MAFDDLFGGFGRETYVKGPLGQNQHDRAHRTCPHATGFVNDYVALLADGLQFFFHSGNNGRIVGGHAACTAADEYLEFVFCRIVVVCFLYAFKISNAVNLSLFIFVTPLVVV